MRITFFSKIGLVKERQKNYPYQQTLLLQKISKFPIDLWSAQVYLKPSKTPKIKFFAKVVNGENLLTIFAKCSILNV